MFDTDFRYEADTDPRETVELILEEDTSLIVAPDAGDGQTIAITADTAPGPVVDALAGFGTLSPLYSHHTLFSDADFA